MENDTETLKRVFQSKYEPTEEDIKRGYVPFEGMVDTEYGKNIDYLSNRMIQYIVPPSSK